MSENITNKQKSILIACLFLAVGGLIGYFAGQRSTGVGPLAGLNGRFSSASESGPYSIQDLTCPPGYALLQGSFSQTFLYPNPNGTQEWFLYAECVGPKGIISVSDQRTFNSAPLAE